MFFFTHTGSIPSFPELAFTLVSGLSFFFSRKSSNYDLQKNRKISLLKLKAHWFLILFLFIPRLKPFSISWFELGLGLGLGFNQPIDFMLQRP